MEIFEKAQNDFENAIKAIKKEEDLLKFKNGSGIGAMRFAIRYTNPEDNKQLYDKIYNIYYDFFNNL